MWKFSGNKTDLISWKSCFRGEFPSLTDFNKCARSYLASMKLALLITSLQSLHLSSPPRSLWRALRHQETQLRIPGSGFLILKEYFCKCVWGGGSLFKWCMRMLSCDGIKTATPPVWWMAWSHTELNWTLSNVASLSDEIFGYKIHRNF